MSGFEAWPGPMEGVFSPEFLQAAGELHLANRWMTAFFRISENCPRQKFFDAFLQRYPHEQELCGQLMGTSPELLGEAALKMVAAGATSLNLNYGCPAKRVSHAGAGGGIWRQPELGVAIARQVAQAVPSVTLSVKLRCGYENFSEVLPYLPRLAEVGVTKFFIHFRTVQEGYLPVPEAERRRRFAAVARACPVPWVLNGDVKSPSEAHDLAAEFGACGVMLARYWLPDPWQLRRLEGDSNVPDAVAGRQMFLQKLTDCGLSGGALIGVRRLAGETAIMPSENSELHENIIKKS